MRNTIAFNPAEYAATFDPNKPDDQVNFPYGS
jgi:hypothetical protein